MRRAVVALLLLPAAAHAERPRDVMVYQPGHATTNAAVTSNVIFLNRCASGCTVHQGGTDNSTTDTSTIGGGDLVAFGCSDAVWTQVVQCMQDVFSPFNVVITDQDPGTTTHLEIMIAGSPQNIGLPANVGGIAPFHCENYQSNALVFDFANVWSCDVNEICATAAQEIAHTWSLDHSTVAADPMTYFSYAGRRYYQNMAEQCGSDCVGGKGPLPGETCSGSQDQDHACYCTGQQTENPYQEILALFGAGTPTPPTVMITSPGNNANVQPGFPVDVTVTSPYGPATMASISVDGGAPDTLTSQPFDFNAPTTLAQGTHTVVATGYDPHGVTATAMIQVVIGKPCSKPSDCPNETDTCIGGRCVPGTMAPGGLGTACTNSSMCADGNCQSDGTNGYCTEPCMKGQCPSGFGCLTQGSASTGICWPNYEDGSDAGPGAPLGLGLGLTGALVLMRRRKR